MFQIVVGRTKRSETILLHLLQKCSDDHFHQFLQVLHRTKQAHIIDKYFTEGALFVPPPCDASDGPCCLGPDLIGRVGGDWQGRLVRQHSLLVASLEVTEELIRELEAKQVLNSCQREVLLVCDSGGNLSFYISINQSINRSINQSSINVSD